MSARGFLDLDHVLVPTHLAEAAQQHLRAVGRKELEGFALWVGRSTNGVFHVDQTIIPAQSGLRFVEGVCVRVDGDELFRINQHLYAHGLSLIAQLHSHPGEAYHSETDDTYPIATTVGALSLVVPDFAVRPFALSDCAVYRLSQGGEWAELESDAVQSLVHLLA